MPALRYNFGTWRSCGVTASGVPRSASAVVPVGNIESAADPLAAIEPMRLVSAVAPFRAPLACRGPHRPYAGPATSNWRPFVGRSLTYRCSADGGYAKGRSLSFVARSSCISRTYSREGQLAELLRQPGPPRSTVIASALRMEVN
jgi:hypothetical protein